MNNQQRTFYVDIVFFDIADRNAIQAMIYKHGFSIVVEGRTHFRVIVQENQKSILSEMMNDSRIRTIDPVSTVKHF